MIRKLFRSFKVCKQCFFSVVGDPYAGVENLEYRGCVYIFTGSLDTNNTLSFHLTDIIGQFYLKTKIKSLFEFMDVVGINYNI